MPSLQQSTAAAPGHLPLQPFFFFDNLMPEFELRLRISAYPFYDLCLLFGMRYIFVFRVSSTHKLRHLIATGAKESPQNTWDLTREEHFYTPHVFAYLMQLPKGSLPLELAAKRKRIQRYPSQTEIDLADSFRILKLRLVRHDSP